MAKVVLDTSEYESGVSKVKDSSGVLQKDAQKISDQFENARFKVEKLGTELAGASEESTEAGDKLGDLEKSANGAADGMGDVAKASEKMGDAVSRGESKIVKFGNALKNSIVTGAKMATAAFAAVSATVVSLGKSAIENYGNYEQLIGGIETLFGAGGKSLEEYAASVGQTVDEASAKYESLMLAQEMMLDYAADAYKTSGMSANEYMETVTGFSAALISSVGGDTVKAAELADKALRDISDNANKMGSDMSSIQNAYQGFAKQNYTMLDNLKLGYGGTKSEMERLLETANELNAQQGIITDYQIESYADIVEAIHVVQTEMGITGTTALEANTTIQGSASSMKASWTNLVTGLADDNADIGTLLEQFTESAGTVFQNVAPRVETIINTLGSVIEKKLPAVAEKIPTIISKYLPKVLKIGGDFITNLIKGIGSNKDSLISSAMDVVVSFADYILDALPKIPEKASEIITSVVEGITEAIPELVPAAIDSITEFAINLTSPGNLDKVIDAGGDMINTLAESLFSKDSIDKLVEAVPKIIAGLVSGFVSFVSNITEIARTIIENIKEAFSDEETRQKMLEGAGEIVVALALGIIQVASDLLDLGADIMNTIWDGMKSSTQNISNWLSDTVRGWLGIGPRVVDSIGGAVGESIRQEYGDTLDMGDGLYAQWDYEKNGYVSSNNPSPTSGASASDFSAGNANVQITQNIYGSTSSAADLMEESVYQINKYKWLGGFDFG